MALVTAAALHAALLESDSATTVLERICQAPIRIRRLAVPPPAPPPIALPSGPRMEHRRVALVCGNTALSEADLWFLPNLLTPAMVRALAETDEPFGRVVQALSLRRTTLEARQFGPDEPAVLEHRALLCTKAGEAVAEVWERYGRSLVSAS